MNKSSLLTAERVRELLNYDPKTGILTWRRSMRGGSKSGDAAGCLNNKNKGYVLIGVDGRRYYSHRIIWLHVCGVWPTADIDHINGIKSDNRLINLREATRGENSQNQRRARVDNKSGHLGVSWNKKLKKWQAQIQVDGNGFRIGLYQTAELAHAAYIRTKRVLHAACTI